MSPIYDLMVRSTDGLFAINSEKQIIFWNRACEQLTGIPADEALGAGCHEVLNGHDPHGRALCGPNCPISALTMGGPPPAQLPMRITHADGRVLQLCVGTMLIPSAHDKKQWNVVHFMRRGRDSQVNEIADYVGWVEQATACESGPSRHPSCQAGACLLTSRELEILRLLAQGTAVNTMSERLHISVATVRNHIQHLMAKLDVHNRIEAVAYAHRHQLI